MEKDNVPRRVIDRALERIEKTPGGCWVWPGAKSKGYGRIGWREAGKAHYASVHRLVYVELVGPIADGLDLDHLCHDPSTCVVVAECEHRQCCNPAHLEPVSRQVNLLRGGTVSAERASVTHCPAGHDYDASNTYTDKLGRRFCRMCVRLRNREYYHRNKERRSEYNRTWRMRNIATSD